MEVVDVVIFSLARIGRSHPLVASMLTEIFQLEDANDTIHGDAAEIKEMVAHCLRLKGSAQPAFEDQLEDFIKNYSNYVNVITSMSAEHMVNCVEGETLDEDDDDFPSDDHLDDVLDEDLYTDDE